MPFMRSKPPRRPPFDLSEDQIATVLDLICRGSRKAREHVSLGMREPDINLRVWQSMRQIKDGLKPVSIEVYSEVPVASSSAHSPPSVLRKPDIFLKFIHQFGNEDEYVAIECKRVKANDTTLNGRYVAEGVDRFATGKYAKHHRWAFMLGYVLALPVEGVILYIDNRLRERYGPSAVLTKHPPRQHSLAICENALIQGNPGQIRLMHVFVDMLSASS